MKHLRYALIAVGLLFPAFVHAATCFWVPIVVSGAVSGTGGVCRLTVTTITGSGLVAGDTVIVAGLIGATECNGTTTISTVVDSTHIELTGTTFTSAYVSGGTVAGGHWTTTNTAMWASATGGTVGTCAATGGVPKQAADTATFDGSSGGGTVTVDTTINGVTLGAITMGAFTGTLDFSVNNPSMTLNGAGFSGTGSGTRTLKLGSGTFTLTPSGGNNNAWNFATTTNLTLNAGTSTISLAPTVSVSGETFSGGGQTYHNLTLTGGAQPNVPLFISGSNTFSAISITAPAFVEFNGGTTQTITTAFSFAGSSSSSAIFLWNPTVSTAATISVASGTATCAWCAISGLTFSGGATFTATNSFDLKGNTGITISGPSGGGGGHIIGG